MVSVKFTEQLIATMAMYGKSVSEFEISVWEKALKRFDDDAKCRALQDHIQDPDNGQFAPKVANIIKLIEGDTKDKAHVAWAKAFDTIQTVGQYEDVCFDDGVIHSVIEEMGGWVKFCLMKSDDISYNQHRFKELYITNFKAQKPHPKLLTGVASQQNRLTGRPVAKPIPIGNIEQCRLVYKNGGGYRQTNGGNLIGDVVKKITQEVA